MTQPINAIFRLLQRKERVQLWLYENTALRLEGVIIGFDEYMNVVLDEATEIDRKHHTTTQLGRILLKGDNITLIQLASDSSHTHTRTSHGVALTSLANAALAHPLLLAASVPVLAVHLSQTSTFYHEDVRQQLHLGFVIQQANVSRIDRPQCTQQTPAE